MDNKIFSLLVIIICFGFIGIISAIYWMMIALDYQKQLEDKNNQIYALYQNLETCIYYGGEDYDN